MAFWGQNKESDGQQGQQPAQQPAGAAPAGTLEEGYNELVKDKGRAPGIDLAIKLSDLILEHAVAERSSDVHIETQAANLRVRFRVDGILQDMLTAPKNAEIPLTQRIRVLAGFDPEPPASFRTEEGRFQKIIAGRAIQVRVSSFPTVNGEKLVLRILDRQQLGLDLEQIGMDQESLTIIKKLIRNPYGIFFITGSTGSGKTTSLYAMLRNINTPMINIITLEDPVEYRLEGINQAQINNKSGFTWAEGLRTILRQDPDVIMVGEIRDPETAAISVQAAMTGHRVLSTVHTNDAAGAVTRFIEMGVEPFLISTVLLASFAQRLVRTVCPYCKEPYRPPAKALAAWGLDKYEKANFQHGKGCYQCLNTGYKGRTGIFEVLINDSLIQDMIVKKSSAHEIIRVAEAAGKLRNLKTDAAGKVLQGITTLEEAASAVMV